MDASKYTSYQNDQTRGPNETPNEIVLCTKPAPIKTTQQNALRNTLTLNNGVHYNPLKLEVDLPPHTVKMCAAVP